MEKYSGKQNNQNPQRKQRRPRERKKNTGRILLMSLLAVLLAALAWLAGILLQREIPTLEDSGETTRSEEAGAEQESDAQGMEEATEPRPIELAEGLQIRYISSYAGMYMEDGTNEVVSDVMMVILENTGKEDLQLARITIEYSGFTAEFEVTNLPAGEKAVLLEKNRHTAVEEDYQSIQIKNVVYFPEAMSLQEERLRIIGDNGTLTVENISQEDIPGDIYIYYKHSAGDLLYGGITFRVVVRGGLKAGQSSTVMAGHYTPDTSRLLMAECGD